MTIIKLSLIIIITFFWSIIAVVTGPFNYNNFLPAYHFVTTHWSRWLIWISGIKIEAQGLENIDPDKHYIFVCSHASLFDIPILLKTIENQIKMVAKKELTYIPLFGWSLIAGGYIIIDRKNSKQSIRAMKKAGKKLSKGTSMLIFPEGTRSPDGSVQDFKKGAFMLALQTGFDLLPITIIGSDQVMPKKTFKLNSTTVKVIADESIPVKDLKISDRSALIDRVRNLMIKHKQEQSQ